MKDYGYGIDFGTTNSLLTEWGESVRSNSLPNGPDPGLYMVSDEKGIIRPHPSVVWYQSSDSPVVGLEAKKNLTFEDQPFGGTFFRSIKRKLGKQYEVSLENGDKLPAWEVAAEIFKHLKSHANESQKRSINEAVVTVPVDFDGKGRKDVKKAMESAGISVSSFVHEPFAAMISHYYDYKTKLSSLAGKRVLVFDWGGGTLDLCVAEISDDGKKIFELANKGIRDRAGDEFDLHILREITDRFSHKHARAGDFVLQPNDRRRLLEECEMRKIQLSDDDSVPLVITEIMVDLDESRDLLETIERKDFEKWIALELSAAERCVLGVLEKARLMPTQVDEVLMVGGTSNIPAVGGMLERLFGARVRMAKQPDAAISQGAAIVAAEEWQLYNVNDVCVKLADDSYFPVLKSGEPLTPKTSSQYVFNCVDSRNGEAHLFFHLRKISGDDDFISMGGLSVPTNCPHPKFADLDRVQATFSISKEGTLVCSALSSSEGKKVECELHDLTTGMSLDS